MIRIARLCSYQPFHTGFTQKDKIPLRQLLPYFLSDLSITCIESRQCPEIILLNQYLNHDSFRNQNRHGQGFWSTRFCLSPIKLIILTGAIR